MMVDCYRLGNFEQILTSGSGGSQVLNIAILKEEMQIFAFRSLTFKL